MIYGTPNLLAWATLIAMPLVALVACRVWRPAMAAPALILVSLLFLPERISFDFPGLPSLGKEEITYLSVLAGVLISRPQILARARFGSGLEGLILVLVFCGFLTILTNRDVLQYGPTVKPGLTLWDGLATAFDDLIRFGLPFFLGRALIRTPRDLRFVLMLLVAGGVIYTGLILIELRLSPQLHNWIYGYHQNQFAKNIRFGGYRPTVFMESGIAVGVFMATTVMGATLLARIRARVVGVPARPLSFYLLGILLLCKSIAAAVWGLVFLPVLSLLPTQWLGRMCLVIVAFIAIYPALRMTETFPTGLLVETAAAFDETRAGSLNFRFENEDRMLDRWRERPWFGWGGYARNWIYDPVTGVSDTVPDGAWIIQLGSRGVAGLLCWYILYLWPATSAARNLSRIRGRGDRIIVVGTAAIILVRALDQLPNGFYTSFPIFLAGALHATVRQLLYARRRRPRAARAASVPAEAIPAQ